jgi:hypothetical protein
MNCREPGPLKRIRATMGLSRSRKLSALNLSIFLAEKGGSRTLRGPYDPQTGFEDQRHHRAPSFSIRKINCLAAANRSSVTIPVAICEVPKAVAIFVS